MIDTTNIRELKGVGEKAQQLFNKLNIHTVGDLIRYYPRGYDVYENPVPISEVEEGNVVTVTGVIYGRIQVSGTKNMQVTTLHIKDITGTLRVIWFRMPFLKNTLGKGGVITLRGRVVERRGSLCMEQPEIFFPSATYNAKENTMQPMAPRAHRKPRSKPRAQMDS